MPVPAVIFRRNRPEAARRRTLKRIAKQFQRNRAQRRTIDGRNHRRRAASGNQLTQSHLQRTELPSLRRRIAHQKCPVRFDHGRDSTRIFPRDYDNHACERLQGDDGGGEQCLAGLPGFAGRGLRPGKESLVASHARRFAGCKDDAAKIGRVIHKATITGWRDETTLPGSSDGRTCSIPSLRQTKGEKTGRGAYLFPACAGPTSLRMFRPAQRRYQCLSRLCLCFGTNSYAAARVPRGGARRSTPPRWKWRSPRV